VVSELQRIQTLSSVLKIIRETLNYEAPPLGGHIYKNTMERISVAYCPRTSWPGFLSTGPEPPNRE